MTNQAQIQVKPVLFFPAGVHKDMKWSRVWIEHLQAARQKFRAMLHGHTTFDLNGDLLVVDGKKSIAEYMAIQARTGGSDTPTGVIVKKTLGYETILAELMANPALNSGGKLHRYNFPYCLAVLFVDPDEAWDWGGGRNFNGKMNEGAGFCIIPTRHHKLGQLQSTVLHELGHAFGLVHVQDRAANLGKGSALYRCYYHEQNSPSIMSQNIGNHSNSLEPLKIPGCLIGDEIDALSQNQRIFPGLVFHPKNDFALCDVDTGCPPHDGVSRQAFLGPMEFFWCYTDHGATFGSRIQNLEDTPHRQIHANTSAVGFDPRTMWHSGPVNPQGWVSIEVTFPIVTTLDQVRVHSQHSGKFHRAKEVQIEVAGANGQFGFVDRDAMATADADIRFPSRAARIWKFSFRGDPGGHVVIRGLRFFCDAQELFPPKSF